MLTDEEINDLYRKYRDGEIDSTALQEALRDEVPIPGETLIATLHNFMKAREERRKSDPAWLAFLQSSKKDYLFFIAILGNSFDDMSFTDFAKHAIAYGKESKEHFEAMNDEEKKKFWKLIQDVDVEIKVFGDEF